MPLISLKGFVHVDKDLDQASGLDEDLPSLDIEALQSHVSRDEVDLVFHLPLSALTSPTRIKRRLFRNEVPYSCIDVTDLVTGFLDHHTISSGQPTIEDEVGPGGDAGRIEVWGLTGKISPLF